MVLFCDSAILHCICIRLCYTTTTQLIKKQSPHCLIQKSGSLSQPNPHGVGCISSGARAKHRAYLRAVVWGERCWQSLQERLLATTTHTKISFALQKKLARIWQGSQDEDCRMFSLLLSRKESAFSATSVKYKSLSTCCFLSKSLHSAHAYPQ